MLGTWTDAGVDYTIYGTSISDENRYAVVTGPTSYVGTLTIPTEVNVSGGTVDSVNYGTYPVTEIADHAFFRCSSLTGTLVIPGSVTSIGEGAFEECNNLTGTLVIPGSVKTIGDSAFTATGIEGLVIEDGVETIGILAFFGCSSLTGTLVIPGSVTSIGGDAFGLCYNLTGTLVIPSSVKTIGGSAFTATGIESLVIEDGVETIGSYAFFSCSALAGRLDIPGSVTSIGEFAFSECSSLTGALVIPGSVKTIGEFAFAETGIESLEIEDGVETIGGYAFFACSALTGRLDIPGSVKTIDVRAFGETGIESLEIEDGVETIAEFAFSGCSSLTGALVIPGSVTSIGGYAFENTKIKSVDFSKTTSALNVEDGIFESSALKTIKLGNDIPIFDAYTFYGIPNDGVVFYPWKAASVLYQNFVDNHLTEIDVTGWILCETFSAIPASIGASTVNVAIAPTNVASDIGGGTPGYKYVLKSGSVLPKGLTLNSSTGVVSGTPMQVTPAGKITVKISDSGKDLLFQSTEIEVPYGAVTKAGPGGGDGPDPIVDHHIISNSHDKNFGGKDGLTAFGEDVVVEFSGDLKGKDGVATFVFNEKEYALSSSSGETSISITDLTGADAGIITSGGVDAESLSLLATDDSITVTLPSAFADRLENGTHEMQVWFADSTAGDKSTAGVATIVVRREGNPKSPTIAPLYGGDAPKTGDDNTIALQLTLGGLSLLVLLALIAYRIRQTRLS
ncbi:MAG: leucine-rich repeat protein [Clostridiales Family XIII bacterium]|nr:leucine-rich repeat protein [Clostridiales Family XIII bacterium]